MLPLTPDYFYGSLAFLYLYNTESEVSSCKHLIAGAYRHFQQYISYIMATSFSGGKSRSTGEPPTMGKQLENCITSSASRVHLFCNLQSRARTHALSVIGLYELLDNQTT
jgi:hypothetical protein